MFDIDNQLVCILYTQVHNIHTNSYKTITINIIFIVHCGVQFVVHASHATITLKHPLMFVKIPITIGWLV